MKKRRGFTLIEALISMAVIAILAALGYMGVDEYVTSAKATKIIMNLHTLKKALWEWYVDNRQWVQTDGRVTIITSPDKDILDNANTKPIQEWGDENLKISNYLKRLGASGINMNTKQTVKYKNGLTITNTSLKPGCYGVCDGGTSKDINNNVKAKLRNEWYVGYCFEKNEGGVREKIKGRLKSAGGLWLGTPDAHENPYEDESAAVWLKVR